MCNQIIQFCSNSTKPLLLAGSLLILLVAGAIGYTACTINSLYIDLDPLVAQSNSLTYYGQLLASLYLILVSILACLAAHYDQKHLIRMLALLTILNFLLAAGAILMVPSGKQVAGLFAPRLEKARSLYDFKAKAEVAALVNGGNSTMAPATTPPASNASSSTAAGAAASPPGSGNEPDANELDGVKATRLWDKLQARGCCGLNNATLDWRDKIPKSCCATPSEENGFTTCKRVDSSHEQACICLIESSSLNLLILLALIALINLYLATVTGVNAYRTFHYNEANQNAYN